MKCHTLVEDVSLTYVLQQRWSDAWSLHPDVLLLGKETVVIPMSDETGTEAVIWDACVLDPLTKRWRPSPRTVDQTIGIFFERRVTDIGFVRPIHADSLYPSITIDHCTLLVVRSFFNPMQPGTFIVSGDTADRFYTISGVSDA